MFAFAHHFPFRICTQCWAHTHTFFCQQTKNNPPNLKNIQFIIYLSFYNRFGITRSMPAVSELLIAWSIFYKCFHFFIPLHPRNKFSGIIGEHRFAPEQKKKKYAKRERERKRKIVWITTQHNLLFSVRGFFLLQNSPHRAHRQNIGSANELFIRLHDSSIGKIFWQLPLNPETSVKCEYMMCALRKIYFRRRDWRTFSCSRWKMI